jgi:2-hydroxychromene-2-carboxylate isomerase
MGSIDFFFDIGSPYSYLAFHRIQPMAAEAGVHVRYRPFLLGAVFKAAGNTPPAMVPARGAYMLRDLDRWAAHIGVPFSFPSFFPVNSLLPMRALCRFGPDEIEAPARRIFHAYWAANQDVSMPEVLADLIGADAVASAGAEQIKDCLREHTEDAIRLGAFGAPSFVVGEELFFGNDRLEFVIQAASA